MSTITHHEHPTNLPSVGEKLAGLRRAVLTWLVADGLAWIALAIGGIFLLDLAVDWLFKMDLPQRQVSLALMAAGVAYVAYRRLARPLAGRMSDDQLILEVERRHPELGQSVISAVQFSRVENRIDGLGMSPHMIRATIDQGVRAAGNVNFADVVEQSRLKKNIATIAAVVLAFVLLAVFAPEAMGTWFNRNVLLGSKKWPQDTHLRVIGEVNGRIPLPAGDDLRVEVEVAEGVVPPNVVLEYGPTKSARNRTEMTAGDGVRPDDKIAPDASQKPRYFYTFKNVLEGFFLRAKGGDGDTEWIEVELVARPEVESLDLRLTPPPYMKKPAITLARGEGPYEVYPGSRLAIKGAAATSNLKSATLRIIRRGQPPATHPVTLGSDAKTFSIDLPPAQVAAASYEIDIVDQNDRRARRPEQFVLKAATDRIPSVGAKLEGISGMIVPQAKVPILISASDDFAIDATAVSYRVKTTIEKPATEPTTPPNSPEPPTPSPTSTALWQDAPPAAAPPAAAPPAAPAIPEIPAPKDPATPPEGAPEETPVEAAAPTIEIKERPGKVAPETLEGKYGVARLEHLYPFEIPPLKVNVGDEIEFHVEAVDNDTVSGPKTGKSHRFQLRVVTEEELRADLLRREKDQRKQFEELITGQDDLITDTKALASELTGKLTTPADARATLLKSQKRQHQIGERSRSIATWMEQIALEAENNRLEGPEGRYQKDLKNRVIIPLKVLVGETIPAAGAMLDDARRIPDGEAAKRDAQLDAAIDAQVKIAAEMRTILRYMVKAEGYQEAVNLAYRILDLQGNVSEATKRALRELIEGSSDK